MEPEAVLNLLDSNWFHLGIQQKPSVSSTQILQSSPKQKKSRQMSSFDHTRSKSDDQQQLLSILTTETRSPDSVLKPHLQTILSDKETSWEIPAKPKRADRRKKRGLSKSLSELEVEEVKGFIDLGFVFSEEDNKDSSLVQIIPGLQKLGHHKGRENNEESISGVMRARPYLSEAWEFSQMEDKMLMLEWRLPLAAVTNETDIKDSLRSWAHTVASALR